MAKNINDIARDFLMSDSRSYKEAKELFLLVKDVNIKKALYAMMQNDSDITHDDLLAFSWARIGELDHSHSNESASERNIDETTFL